MKKASVFAMCSLFAAAGHIVAQPAPTIPTNLDHFNCYLAPGPVQPASVFLQDQFDTSPISSTFLPPSFETITDLRPRWFCNPAVKIYKGATTTILNPTAHLLMYQINPQPLTPRSVTVLNQFGTTTLTTGPAVVLAVPSGKALFTPATVAPALPPIPAQGVLDHFKCYTAAGDNLNVVVSLRDQFQPAQASLLRPFLFCNPVEKIVQTVNAAGLPVQSVTPIAHPNSHLTCYLTTLYPFHGVVIYNNQFIVPGTFPTLALSQSEILCVPSAKLSWSVIPTPAPTPNPVGPGD